MVECLPHLDQPNEVMSVLPFDSPESSLEKDAKLFVEEDELGETIDLPQEEVPAQPLVELKPLPAGLHYAFLYGNKETPVTISNKLSDKEMSKLIAILGILCKISKGLAQLSIPIAFQWIHQVHHLESLSIGSTMRCGKL